MAKIVTVRLLLDVESEGEAFDGTNEILREQQRSWAPNSCLVDYSISDEVDDYALPEDYEEGLFTGPI